MKTRNILWIISLILMTACDQVGNYRNTPTNSIGFITPTQNLINTPTEKPTSTLVQPSPIPTNAPTLSLEEKIEIVDTLRKTNGGCEYPCWWGIAPGVSSWNEKESFLSSIAIKIRAFPQENGIINYAVGFPIWDGQLETLFVVRENDNIVDVIRVVENIPILDLVKKYGQPDEIWFSSEGNLPPPAKSRSTLLLLYSQRGISIAYIGNADPISHNNTEYLSVCLNQFWSSNPVWFWSPALSITKFPEYSIDNMAPPPTTIHYKRLEEFTNWIESDFYNSVLLGESDICVETPALIWPDPDY